jgi:hypothetical protein
MQFSSSDLSAFMAAFGVPAVLSPPGHVGRPVMVIFDLNSMDQMGCLTDKPQITIRETDLASIDHTTAIITVVGKYPPARMTKSTPDGTGFTKFLLTRQ